MRRAARVAPSSSAIFSRSHSGARSRRPTNCVWTPSSARSCSSRSIVSPKMSISADTSSGERAQFSVENAYTASDATPTSMAVSTTGRSAREPARCPSATSRPRAAAQRPLPSMTIATARGISVWRAVAVRPPLPPPLSSPQSALAPCGGPERRSSYLHDLGFFVPKQIVDLLRVLVGELLHPLLGAVLVVRPDLARVDELLQVPHCIAPDVADGDAVLLGQPADDLDEVLAALLGELRYRQPDELAVVRGGEAEVGLLDRLLDRSDRARVEGLDGEHARLGDADGRELLQRRLRAVVVDFDAVEQRRRGAAGADGVELDARVLDRLRHTVVGVLDQLVDGCHASWVLLARLDDRSDLLAGDDARDVAVHQLEDVDRQLVVHAKRERGRVHDAQPALDRLQVRQLRDECGRRIDTRVAVVDAG